MPYTAEISRTNPSCFLFLIDQSGSMQDLLDPTNTQQLDKPMLADGKVYTHTPQGRTKAQAVADGINRLLQNLAIRCARSEGIRDYYHVGVLGYGSQVGSAFLGDLAGRELVPISDIANFPARIEERTKKSDDGAGGLIEQTIKFPVWFDPITNGATPMCQALTRAQSIISNWLLQHPGCFPATVLNITDGEATDGDPTNAANALKNLTSDDGSVLLFNAHVSSQQSTPIGFPHNEVGLPDQFAQMLFRISSILPEYMRSIAQQEGFPALEGTRGYVYNSNVVTMLQFLDIGTRPNNLR